MHRVKRKGQGFGIGGDVIPTILSVTVAIIIIAWLIVVIFRVYTYIEMNQETRDSMIHAFALMGDPQLVYNDSNRINRGILDMEKINKIMSYDESERCVKLNSRYTYSGISITRKNSDGILINDIICHHSERGRTIPFPVTIRNVDGSLDTGILKVSVNR